ncbi:549_t:CDS:2 [Acaulospora colombiana]|uniref:549_t:CDS:1 n=1 Tax=Acaulospora colombiana TaxID=27376 RepID=A0ACA9KR86_9GLOM|nr:549_t:CDS:2 [Acaulospora colombiana]
MAEPDEEILADPTTITWRSIEWIQAQPEGQLNSSNVLNYFAESTFWDRSCNNASLQMQTPFNKAYEHVEFHPATGYTWKFGESQTESSKSRAIQQPPAELVTFRAGIEHATQFATTKWRNQYNQAALLSKEDDGTSKNGDQSDPSAAIGKNALDQPSIPPSNPGQPSTSDIIKRRKKSEDVNKKKKKSE